MIDKSLLNSIISEFVKDHCSPVEKEKIFSKNEYSFLQDVLTGIIFLSGSYPRFTAITPLNDLDIFWILSLGEIKSINEGDLLIENLLTDLADKLSEEYKKNGKKVSILPQSHSIVVEFLDNDHEFSIDIVPAYELSITNEFSEPFYNIPEVGLMNARSRKNYYESHENTRQISWIKTDPKGYKKAAIITNDKSKTFRKTTKLLKKWKRAWKRKKNFPDIEFKLKSFHIELIVQKLIEENPNLDILTTIQLVFININSYISTPQFKDRAQDVNKTTRYIDNYIQDLSNDEKYIIEVAAKSGEILLKKLIKEPNRDKIVELLHRLLNGEEFIGAYGYDIDKDTIKDNAVFAVDGYVLKKTGFTYGWLKSSIPLLKGLTRGNQTRSINFAIQKEPHGDYVSYWKVRNKGIEALKANCLRGEINKHTTLNTPEITAFKGTHHVTCYLVDENNARVVSYSGTNIKIL